MAPYPHASSLYESMDDNKKPVSPFAIIKFNSSEDFFEVEGPFFSSLLYTVGVGEEGKYL
jgi:hypothetical protein